MHPRVFFDGFWRNDLKPEVFVAMDFRDEHQARWMEIFKPTIEGELIFSEPLRAIRIDIRKSGDSILSEILAGVGHSQLVVADVSVTDRWVENGQPRWARNGNVMYEVGLALACRQPVEVVLLRDTDEPILFDISHIPVVKFFPDRPGESVVLLRTILRDRLRERQLLKDLRVTRLLESLSQFEVNLIRSNAHLNALGWTGPSLPAAVVMALPGLLEKQVLRLARIGAGDQPSVYTWTTFGRVVADILKNMKPSN